MTDNKLFSGDTETLLLAGILNNPSLIHSINGLRSYMFSSSPNQKLFMEMEELKAKGYVPEPSLVVSSLESKSEIDSVGGKKQIEYLLNKNVNPEGFEEYVNIIVASYKARNYISITSSAKPADINASNIDNIINNTRKSLSNLLELQNTSGVVHIGDITTDVYKEIISRRDKPGIRGVSWGVDILDRVTGGKAPGDLWVIGGRPGSGKTALVCNSILQDGLAGVPSLLIEREMRKQELTERLISIDSGIPNNFIRTGVLDNKQMDIMYNSVQKLSKLPIYIDTNFMSNDPFYIEGTINKFRNNHGVKNVYLDYIQIATDRDENQTQAIGRLSRLLKLMANDLSICVILLSQLNRKLEEREDKRPLMSDFKMSGALEEDPDFAVGLYRDAMYSNDKNSKYADLMEFIVLKHRNGPPGIVTVRFDGPTYRIQDT